MLIFFNSKNQAINVALLKTKATVKLVYTKWRILGICSMFLLYFLLYHNYHISLIELFYLHFITLFTFNVCI